MYVSVIICAYTIDRLNDIRDAIVSLLNQTHDDLEIIVVVDEDKKLYRAIKNEFDVKVLFNERRIG